MSARAHAILLVEDNEDDILLIERAFRKANVANPLVVARDGEEAVAYLSDLAANPVPELVLLDLRLPRKSGFEVLEWLRAQPGLRRMPVVVLTSSGETPDIDRAYDLGANSYLVKPVGFEALLNMVKVLGLYWLLLNRKPSLGKEEGQG
ncbi:MAG: response regulator [Anaerolineae bacterium]